jgi:hypothetical protein
VLGAIGVHGPKFMVHSLLPPPCPALSTDSGKLLSRVPLDSALSVGPAQAGPHPLGPSQDDTCRQHPQGTTPAPLRHAPHA